MKNVFGAAALLCAFAAGSAIAGGVSDPVIEAPVVVEEATNSSSGEVVVAIMALLLLGVAMD